MMKPVISNQQNHEKTSKSGPQMLTHIITTPKQTLKKLFSYSKTSPAHPEKPFHKTKSLDSDSLIKFNPTQLVKSRKSSETPPLFDPVLPEPVRPSLIFCSSEIARLDTTSTLSYHSDDDSKETLSPIDSGFHEHLDEVVLQRRLSCPDLSRTTSTSSTLVDKQDIISITEEHTRHVSLLKKNSSVEKPHVLKSCQRAKAKAAELASQGEKPQGPFFCEEQMRLKNIPNLFDPVSHEPVLKFNAIKPRTYQLHRKTSWKKEAKALMAWRDALESLISSPHSLSCLSDDLPKAKLDKATCTRKFILKEFFNTEVNFWNQLNYTKRVYYDALEYSFNHPAGFSRPEDTDVFVNLFDLMQFSAKLINLLRQYQFKSNKEHCSQAHLGKVLREMAEELVVFLRCALDYKDNRKRIDVNERSGIYDDYKQLLSSRKETSRFSIKEYLILPIQRAARYGLLISDLIRHTPLNHPDYENLVMAYQIVTSLTTAMNLVQKK